MHFPPSKKKKDTIARVLILQLSGNQIGDTGLIALSEALVKGALASLEALVVDDGPLGTEHPALNVACEARGIVLS